MINNEFIERMVVKHRAYSEAETRLNQCFKYALSPEATCLAVIGESRTGKSRLLEEFTKAHPAIRDSNGMNRPILYVRTPAAPTVKALVDEMLHSINDPNYHRGTLNEKKIRLRTFIHKINCKVIVVDEFQHFQDTGAQKKMYVVADWLKSLVDETRVSLVVAGLPEASSVINLNEQLRGRFLAPVVMPRFEWTDTESREEFCAILGAFHEAMTKRFSLPDFGKNDLAFRFYCGTGGLIGYVTKVLTQVVRNAVDQGEETITYNAIEKAHREAVWNIEGANGLANPFDRSITLTPSVSTLSDAKKVGVSCSGQVFSDTPIGKIAAICCS